MYILISYNYAHNLNEINEKKLKLNLKNKFFEIQFLINLTCMYIYTNTGEMLRCYRKRSSNANVIC